jgi:DNA-binding NarL/FixJ family response regulator
MEQVTEPMRILLADDHPIFRYGMCTLLTAMPDMTVAGEAVTGEEAIQLTDALLPDLVLMDINMPSINGIEATARIRAQHPRTAVLIVTMLDDDSVFAAMRAGARGYLLKGADPAETLRAIRAVASGEAIFSPGVAERVMNYFAHPPVAPVHPVTLAELSEREREVLTP